MKQRERILAVLAVAVLALALGDLVVLGPLAEVWHRTKADLSAARTELSASRELVKREETLRARYGALADRLEGDVGSREGRFLTFLQEAADRAGLSIASERPSRRSYGEGSKAQLAHTLSTVGLTFTCSVGALEHFLVELAAGEEAVRVKNLEVNSLDPAGSSLKVSLYLTTLTLPETEGAGPWPPLENSPDEAGGKTQGLLTQYQPIVERNIFSRFARSPRPEPRPEVVRVQAPPSRPGSGHILTGVVLGGGSPVALVEEAATGVTRVYSLGAETPIGRLETIGPEGVSFAQGEEHQLIRVGYTLSGERSAKLASTMTLASGASLSTSSSESSPASGRVRGRGGWPGARGGGASPAGTPGAAAPAASSGETSPAARAEIVRRLRERRLGEMGQPPGEEESNGPGSEDAAPEPAPGESPPEEVAGGGGTNEE